MDRSYLQEAESRLKSQKAQALAALKNAHEVADYEKVAKAQEVLAKIAVEENKVTTSKTQLEYQQNVQEEQQTNYQNYVQQPQQNVAPQLGEREQAWVEKNEWFGQDEVMTMGAMAINNQLEAEGFDVGSEEYYTEVDRRMRKRFPQEFTESSVKSKPQQKVASAGRVAGNPGSNKRQVKLSPSEVQMAKRLNVPLGEYAKYVKR